MKSRHIQYTIRSVPESVDRVLRKKARLEEKSLNDILVHSLTVAAGLAGMPENHMDLDWIAGTWIEDKATNQALLAQRKIDPELWK